MKGVIIGQGIIRRLTECMWPIDDRIKCSAIDTCRISSRKRTQITFDMVSIGPLVGVITGQYVIGRLAD